MAVRRAVWLEFNVTSGGVVFGRRAVLDGAIPLLQRVRDGSWLTPPGRLRIKVRTSERGQAG